MQPVRILLVLIAVALAGAVPAAAAPARTADARQLLLLAETGLAGVLQAARASEGRVDPARPEQRPFWDCLGRMETALRRARAGLAARDGRFYAALELGTTVLGELRVVQARGGVDDPHVSQGVRILSSSWQLLRGGYGREAVRHRQGGGLTAVERQRFLRLQGVQQRFAESLHALQEAARRRRDEAMLAELQRMADEAWRLAAARLTLDAYLNARMIADAQRGEWAGNSYYALPDDGAEWSEAGAAVEDLYVDGEVGHIFLLDLGAAGGGEPAAEWAYLEQPTELPGELAGVELFEPAGEWVDLFEEEEALLEEEMEEVADSDLEIYDDMMDEGSAEPEPEEGADGEDEEKEEEPAAAKGLGPAEAVVPVEVLETDGLPGGPLNEAVGGGDPPPALAAPGASRLRG